MEKNKSLTINLSYSEGIDLESFITLNKIEDEDKFNKKCWKQGFDIEKYGLLVPVGTVQEKIIEIPIEKIVEKEIIREIFVDKIVELPVEVVIEKQVFLTDDQKVSELIAELEKAQNQIVNLSQEILRLSSKPPVEKIIEVPVEVVVEKIVEVGSLEETNKKQQMLQETIQKLRQELQKKTQEISDLNEKINNRHFTSDVKGIYLDGSNLNKTIKTN